MPLEAIYTAGIVARTDQRPLDVINELAEAMAGRVAFVGNQLIMRAGAYVAPVLALGDDDFAGGSVSLQVRQPRENLFNVVTGTIIDAAQGWKPDVDFPRVEAQAYIDADGGTQLPLAVQFGAVSRATQAQQLAAVMLRRERQALTLVARFKLSAFAIELFDTIELSSSRYGWTAKPFEVVGRKWTLEGLIDLTLRETDPTIYAFGDVFDEIDVAPNTNIPLQFQVEQLSNLAVESGTAELTDGSIITRTKVTWTPSTDQSVLQNGKVEIQYHPATDPYPADDWPGTFEQGSAEQTTIVGLHGGLAYLFRGRFIGMGGRIRGPWSTPQVLHVIAQPPNVGGQNFFTNGSFELDTANIGDNWAPYTNGTTGTVTHSDATGIFGARAQRLDCTNLGATDSDQAGYQQGVNLIGMVGKTLTQSIYAEGTPGAKFFVFVDWYTASGGTVLSETVQQHTLSSEVQRLSLTATVPIGSTFGRFYFVIAHRSGGAGAAYVRIDAAQLEIGSVATAFSETADEAIAIASAALTTANAAAINASAAIAQLTSIASDSVLSPDEKPQAILDYNVLTSEQIGIDNQATSFGIVAERDSYDTALSNLSTYLATLTGWNVVPGSNVTISGTNWRSFWSAAYTTRQTLLNKIADEAAKRASWAQVTGAGKPADDASADLALVTRGNCVATGNRVNKVGGVVEWDSDAYSKNGFVGGCFAAAQVSNFGGDMMFGLNSDPTTDQSYTSLDYAWFFTTNPGSELLIYENGVQQLSGISVSLGDVLAIVYDGARVQYLRNNTLIRTVAAPADLNLFWDSSFLTPGPSELSQIRFGPLSGVTNIGTGQLAPGAVNDIYKTDIGTSPIAITAESITPLRLAAFTRVAYVTFVAAADGVALVNATTQLNFTSSSNSGCQMLIADDAIAGPSSAFNVATGQYVLNSNVNVASQPVQLFRQIPIVAGTTYTIGLYFSRNNFIDTASVNNGEFVCRVVKR